MKLKICIIVIAIATVVGYGFGRFTTPEKVVTKVETVEVIKEVIKEVKIKDEKKKETVKRKTKTVIKEYPDGRKITEIYEVTEDTIFVETQEIVDLRKQIEDLKKQNESKIIISQKPQWKFQGLAGVEITRPTKPIYGLGVERRIIGPIFMGVYGKSNSEAGVSLSLEF
jgi:hypothetical protein